MSILQDRMTYDHTNIGRCTPHQIIKGKAVAFNDKERRCIFCKNYTLSLKANTCINCLGTAELDNFKVDEVYLLSKKRFEETHEHIKENN